MCSSFNNTQHTRTHARTHARTHIHRATKIDNVFILKTLKKTTNRNRIRQQTHRLTVIIHSRHRTPELISYSRTKHGLGSFTTYDDDDDHDDHDVRNDDDGEDD